MTKLVVAFVAGVVCAQAAKPVVELSLANPSAPYPAVSSAIASAEAARAGSVKADVAAIESAYKATLSQASVALGNTIARALGRASFANIAEPTISVKIEGGHSDEGAGVAGVKAIEGKRGAAESALVASARKEFDEVAKVVIAEFDRQVRAHGKGSFLRFSRQINVRVGSDPSYATVSSLLEQMESRRDAAEAHLRATILSREMDLVQALNRIGAAALSH
eukprot:CAMPEP_0178991368 /NCGR_PEP_ID=MMETSP0795-20121207/5483_1 /TAXON_ID=88552 /ORGANISM="Amoebophrya sp., Strain Ameob2" /LENGTH=220 /DNA_ID=CAMNT_0020683057 /DNA_START=383 /DNA_END=1045 /DNA_ORIENTATION=-